jgi:hypothetical protein
MCHHWAIEADFLLKRLESQVFRAMQLPDSPLYEPGLAALLKMKKDLKAKPRRGYVTLRVFVLISPLFKMFNV